MNGPRRTFDEKLKSIGGILSILSTFVTLMPQVRDLLVTSSNLPPSIWYIIPLILFLVGIFALWDGLRRRSRLLRPEELLLKTDNPAHLKGREEDIERLSALCHEYQQVHLVGESGSGKSALIQAGLCPALKAEGGIFPIYLDVWGQDWQEGPRTALNDALWEALSGDDRRVLGLTALPRPVDLVSTLEQLRAKQGRTPLLIFDQFDDYQTRHRAQFLAGRRRTWFSAGRLIEVNGFWRDMKKLIDTQVIHCLFATRADTADGLESIRFVPPQVYRLDRLSADFVLPLLTELTGNTDDAGPVVFAPERGWERLKSRLARDLSQDGAVLPVQMKIALQGLASLGSLTVRDYERAGGLHGLEAAHIERHVANTARHSDLTKLQVRSLLTSLADAETLKTVPKSAGDLEKAIILENEIPVGHLKRAVVTALDDLEMKEVIRKRLDSDTREHVWILDHDYLCRGVLEAERRANRWFALAQEGSQAFQDAGNSVWRRWRSLLSPRQQIMLVTQRFRARFRYGTLRSYAAWSLLRFVPYFAVGATVSFVGLGITRHQEAERARVKAAQIRAEIGLHDFILPAEVDYLWELAVSSDAVRDSFLEQALEHPDTAGQFNRRADMAVQALVGLDSDKRQKIIKTTVLPCLHRLPMHLNRKIACIRVGAVLALADEDPQFPISVIKMLTESIGATTNPIQLFDLISTLRVVAEKLAPAEAQAAYTQLLTMMQKTTPVMQYGSLAEALTTVAEKLAPAEVQAAFAQLLAIMEKSTDSMRLWSLAMPLNRVAEKLAPAEAQATYTQLLTMMEKSSDAARFGALSGALAAVAGRLAPAEAQAAYTQLLTMMEKSTTSERLWILSGALAAVAGRLAPAQAQAAYTQLLTMMEKSSDSIQLSSLAGTLTVVAEELAPAEAQAAYTQLLTIMERTADSMQHSSLAGALAAVAGRLAPAQAQAAYTQLLTIMERTADSMQHSSLAGVLRAVAGRLAPAEAQAAFAQLLAMMGKSTDATQFSSLAGALVAVAGRLAPAEAYRVFTHLLTVMEQTTDSWLERSLTEALKSVQGTLEPQQIINFLKRPKSVGVLRSTLLEMLEKQTGQKFDDNLWKMVTWAHANGLDVKSPPKRPDK